MPKKSTLIERLEKIAEETKPADVPAAPPPDGMVAAFDAEAKRNILAVARTKRGASIPPNESKHDKLLRLSNARVTKACKAIAMVGNLASYKPTPGEVEKIMLALGESCARTSNRLNGIRNEVITFTLN